MFMYKVEFCLARFKKSLTECDSAQKMHLFQLEFINSKKLK